MKVNFSLMVLNMTKMYRFSTVVISIVSVYSCHPSCTNSNFVLQLVCCFHALLAVVNFLHRKYMKFYSPQNHKVSASLDLWDKNRPYKSHIHRPHCLLYPPSNVPPYPISNPGITNFDPLMNKNSFPTSKDKECSSVKMDLF